MNSVVLGRMTLGLALLSGLVLRLLPLRNFHNPQGGFFFYSVDAYDHLRRITLGVSKFPGLADFDYYAAFPHGLGQLWAPGFDYLLSALCLLAGGSRAAIETVCFLFNPLAAALAVLAVYGVGRTYFKSQTGALVAAVVLAFHPATIGYTWPMNFDHHAIEPLVALLLFSLPLFEDRTRLSPVAMAMAVCSLLLAILFWRGSTMYWGLSFVSVLGRVFFGNHRLLARDYAVVFGTAALLLAGYCLLDPWGGAGEIAFGVISWFHVMLLAGATGTVALFAVCRTRQRFGWSLGGLGALLLVAVLAGPLAGMLKQFAGGLSFVRGQGDPWLDTNSELRGVFKDRFSFWYSASFLTPFWFLAPVAVWLGYRQWQRGGRVDPLLLNFLVWSPLLATGFIIRYSPIAGLFTSLAMGFLAVVLVEHRGGRWSSRRSMAAAVFLLLLPGLPHYRESISADLPGYMKYGLYGEQGVLTWLKEKTPATANWSNPVTRPEYGVLARWPLGARIYQIAERPAVSTAFGWEGYGFYQEAAFWITEDEAKALEIASEAQARYVLVQAVHDLQTDFNVAVQGQARGALRPASVGRQLRAERSMHARLMLGDGSMMKAGGDTLPALHALRLVYESPFQAETASGADLSYYKVFEVVKGAVISGKAPPAESVILALDLMTTRQRKLTYLTRVQVNQEGTFMVRVPYATTGRQGDTRPLGDYTLYVGQAAKGSVTVTENDVALGKTVGVGEPGVGP